MQSSLPEQLAQHRAFRPRLVQAVLRRCERWLVQRADTVMSSTGLAQTVRLHAPRVPVAEWQFPRTLPPVSDSKVAALRQRLEVPADAPVVVYSGTFEEYQGLDTLVEAIPRVCRQVPGAVFVLVGGDPAAAAGLKSAAQRQGLNGHLRVLPRQAREEIPCYLALANVLVSSRTYGDNLPLKIFDYLAAGRPVVATDIPSHRTILHSGRALLVPPDAEGLAQGIIQILTEPQRAETLVVTAAAYAAQHLEWGRFVATIQQVYDRVCERAPAAR
jgi:glycosyltransferase involved in cell wall biosynthesis